MKRLLVQIIMLVLLSCNIFAEDSGNSQNIIPIVPINPIIPVVPLVPSLPIEESTNDSSGNELKWKLDDSYTINLDTKVQVVVPLEIITDVDIKSLIIDDQELTVPFELEMNKKPDKENFYMINYSETQIDIDNDGVLDTFIYSPKYINKKLVKDNYLYINGKNITREGIHKKKIYITVELSERR